jgi:membrane-associated protein
MAEHITFIDLLLHTDEFLTSFIVKYGVYVYILIFVILFCETGLFCPLPGDSLIFACGAFAAAGLLNIWILVILSFIAAILGDSLNYYLGYAVGKRIYTRANKGRLIKRESIDRAKEFYDKHGGKAIIFSRFIPLVRQCTPFVAGIGRMTFQRFMSFNLIGGTAWVGIASLLGYFFGNIPVIKDNFSTVILAIIFISLLPAIIAYLKSRFKRSVKSE